MRAIGGILQGAPCMHMIEKIKNNGQFVSQQISMFGAPHPVVGTVGLRTYVGMMDGEIYNKETLHKELYSLGYRFADRSDTAVMLHGYMAWGADCLEKFIGVFALAVWDGEKLFLARDRLGIKSIFYQAANGDAGNKAANKDTGKFVFSSALPVLLAHPGIKPTLTAEGAAELILLGPGRTPGSGILQGIHELKPGHFMQTHPGEALYSASYWELKARPHLHNLTETTAHIRDLLSNQDCFSRDPLSSQSGFSRDSLSGQGGISRNPLSGQTVFSRDMISYKKNPWPTLLSGGLDSSILASLAGSKETYSLDFIGNDEHFTASDLQPEDDNAYIAEMTRHLRANHTRHLVGTDELADALTSAVEARGLPGMADVDASLLLFCRKVRVTAPAVLSGEGADEIFGGYPWYTDETRRNADTFPWSLNTAYRADFLHPKLRTRINAEKFIRSRFTETMRSAPTLYDDSETDKKIRRIFILNLQWFFQTLAARSECMARAANLTIRMPFLDHRLVEYAYNIPWAMKHHNDREKGLLREAFKKYLPEKIINRKKSPFPKTHNPAYLQKVTDLMQALLNAPAAPLFEILNRQNLNAESPTPWYGQLMMRPQALAYFLQINAWLEKYNVDIAF